MSKLQEDKGLPSYLTGRINKQRLEGQALKGRFADPEIAVLYHQVCRALCEQEDNMLKTGTSTTQWTRRRIFLTSLLTGSFWCLLNGLAPLRV